MVGFLEGRQTEDLFRESRRETRRYAKSFYFASHVLPREKRRAAYAVYAFCRYADNIVDAADIIHETHHALSRLRSLREQLAYLYTCSPLMDPRLRALQETVISYRIPMQYFQDLLRGVEMDLSRSRYETFGQLKEYCYCVASVVGLMMARILGVTDEQALRHAADMGTAMQLTNILRDVREDYDMGRVYLPADEMEELGVREDDLRLGRVTPAFRNLMSFQIARARSYYASGAQGYGSIPNDGSRFCVKLMAGTYAGILDAIEAKAYDVFTWRAHVTLPGKLAIAVRQLFRRPAAGVRRVLATARREAVPRTGKPVPAPDPVEDSVSGPGVSGAEKKDVRVSRTSAAGRTGESRNEPSLPPRQQEGLPGEKPYTVPGITPAGRKETRAWNR